VGLYRPVHVKTLRSQKLRMLLTHCKLVQSKAIDIVHSGRNVRFVPQADSCTATQHPWPDYTCCAFARKHQRRSKLSADQTA